MGGGSGRTVGLRLGVFTLHYNDLQKGGGGGSGSGEGGKRVWIGKWALLSYLKVAIIARGRGAGVQVEWWVLV